MLFFILLLCCSFVMPSATDNPSNQKVDQPNKPMETSSRQPRTPSKGSKSPSTILAEKLDSLAITGSKVLDKVSSVLASKTGKPKQDKPEKDSDISSSIETINKKIRESSRFRQMFLILQNSIPSPVIEIMGDYEKSPDDDSLTESYERVMDDLKIPFDKRTDLDPYNPNLFNTFLPLIEKKKDNFSFASPFWLNLLKFTFEWSLYMRKSLGSGDRAFLDATKKILPTCNIIMGKSWLLHYPKVQENLTKGNFGFFLFQDLFYYKLLEDPELLGKFASIISDVYYGDQGRTITIDYLKEKYIEMEEPNVGVLLSLFLVKFDPSEKIRNLFTEEKLRISHKKIPSPLPFSKDRVADHIRSELIKELGKSKLNYTSASFIKFCLDNKVNFQIEENSIHFIYILKSADRMTIPLTRETLIKLIKFKVDGTRDTYAWNKEKFIACLNHNEKEISPEDYKRYLELADSQHDNQSAKERR